MSEEKNFDERLRGTGELRTYASGKTYRKLKPEERKIGVRKPDDPRAVFFAGNWYLPLDVLPDEERVLPETRPDDEAYRHFMTKSLTHTCDVCERPEAERWHRKARRELGMYPMRDRKPRASSPSR